MLTQQLQEPITERAQENNICEISSSHGGGNSEQNNKMYKNMPMRNQTQK
jgi:hypothetical protein